MTTREQARKVWELLGFEDKLDDRFTQLFPSFMSFVREQTKHPTFAKPHAKLQRIDRDVRKRAEDQGFELFMAYFTDEEMTQVYEFYTSNAGQVILTEITNMVSGTMEYFHTVMLEEMEKHAEALGMEIYFNQLREQREAVETLASEENMRKVEGLKEKIELIQLPKGHETEYFGLLDDENYFLIHRPKEGWDYSSFIAEIGPFEDMAETQVFKVVRYRDGGTTYIDTAKGMFYFPTPFSDTPVAPTLGGKPIIEVFKGVLYHDKSRRIA